MRLLTVPAIALCLALAGGCYTHPVQAQTPESQRLGLPASVGSWKLSKFVPGKQAHFLYTQKRRSFSLFVTDSGREDSLQARKGWTSVRLPGGDVAYIHTDPRDPERSAIAWKRGQQRRILIGRMEKAELQNLATKL